MGSERRQHFSRRAFTGATFLLTASLGVCPLPYADQELVYVRVSHASGRRNYGRTGAAFGVGSAERWSLAQCLFFSGTEREGHGLSRAEISNYFVTPNGFSHEQFAAPMRKAGSSTPQNCSFHEPFCCARNDSRKEVQCGTDGAVLLSKSVREEN